MRARLEALENTQLQSRLEAMGEKPSKKTLQALVQEGQSRFELGKHVIPLTQLKGRVEAVEVGLQANGQQIDETNHRLTETTRVLHETLEAELKKMVTKEEFKKLEDKHNELAEKVEKMAKDLVERLEKMIKAVQEQVDTLRDRVDANEAKVMRSVGLVGKEMLIRACGRVEWGR